MKLAFKIIGLFVLVIGCDKTDEKSVRSVPKSDNVETTLPDRLDDEEAKLFLNAGATRMNRGESLDANQKITDPINGSIFVVQGDGNICIYLGTSPRECTMKWQGNPDYAGPRLVTKLLLSQSGSLFLANNYNCYPGTVRVLARPSFDNVNMLFMLNGTIALQTGDGNWRRLNLNSDFSQRLDIGCTSLQKL